MISHLVPHEKLAWNQDIASPLCVSGREDPPKWRFNREMAIQTAGLAASYMLRMENRSLPSFEEAKMVCDSAMTGFRWTTPEAWREPYESAVKATHETCGTTATPEEKAAALVARLAKDRVMMADPGAVSVQTAITPLWTLAFAVVDSSRPEAGPGSVPRVAKFAKLFAEGIDLATEKGNDRLLREAIHGGYQAELKKTQPDPVALDLSPENVAALEGELERRTARTFER